MTVFKYYMGFQTSDWMGYSTKLSLSKGSSKRDPIAGIVLVKVLMSGETVEVAAKLNIL